MALWRYREIDRVFFVERAGFAIGSKTFPAILTFVALQRQPELS
jgi:hypothetical protein